MVWSFVSPFIRRGTGERFSLRALRALPSSPLVAAHPRRERRGWARSLRWNWKLIMYDDVFFGCVGVLWFGLQTAVPCRIVVTSSRISVSRES